MSEAKLTACLSLMRRLPPHKIEQNLNGLMNLLPNETEQLLQRIDQPLEEQVDAEVGRKFLLCDYNRDGESYRSPWTNKYNPPIEDGFLPSAKLRAMEIEFNELFDAYRELYYEGGTSSVYLWDLDHGFAGCFLIKKIVAGDRYVKNGCWDSINVVEVVENDKAATYKLTTTVLLNMNMNNTQVGDALLAGSLTRQTEMTTNVNETKTHISNLGRMIEDMESEMRSNLYELYILKTREVVNSLRTLNKGPAQTVAHIANLSAAVMGYGKTRKTDSEFVA